MNKNIAIILAVMISSVTVISGCSYTSKTDSLSAQDTSSSKVSSEDEEKIDTDSSSLSNQTKSSKTESDTVKNNEKTTQDSNNKVESQKQNETKIQSKDNNTTTSSTKEKDTMSTKKDLGKATTYTAKAGYTLTFPASWEGKYVLEDKNDVLKVSYKCSKDKTSANAWLFSIEKAEIAETEGDLDAFDTIGNIRTFNVKDAKYYVGGPTGLTLGENSADFKDYLEINRHCADVVNSITVIK